MSKFINRKEEVIQIELTPHGRHLYSQGKFKPEYYSFFDDDILYDPDYFASSSLSLGGVQYNPDRPAASEVQNQIVTRIKDTPRPSLQKTFQGVILNGTNADLATIQGDPFERENQANNKFMRPIGSSSPFSEYAPSWEIKTLPGSVDFNGSATGSRKQNTVHGVSYTEDQILSVPKISCSIDIDYLVSQIPGAVDGQEVMLPYWLLLEDNKLIIDVQEVNSIFKANENFDIEVFKVLRPTRVQREAGAAAPLRKLFFVDQESVENEVERLIGDPDDLTINLGQGEESIEDLYPDLDDTFVEYYLNIRTDKEIDDLHIRRVSVPSEGIYSGVPSSPDDPCD